MTINKNNYEAFFLDYHEGNLSAEQTAELMLFLEQHPQLKEEFESFEHISLNDLDEKIKFENKEQLKKSTNYEPQTTDLLFSSYVDDSLSAKEEKELFALLETNPTLKKDFELFKKTKLNPDFSIVFPNKQSLKKKDRGVIVPLYRYVTVAASIALVVTLYFLIGNTNNSEALGVAFHRKPGYIIKKNETLPVNENNNSIAKNNNTQKKIVSPLYVKKNDFTKNKIKQNNNNIQIVQQPKEKKNWEDTLKQQQVIANSNFTPVDKNFFADVNEPEPQQPNSSNYMSVKELVAQNVKTKLLGDELAQDPNEPIKKISWYNVGQLTVKGIRKLTGKDVKLQKEYNSNGDVIAYQIINGDKTYSLPASK